MAETCIVCLGDLATHDPIDASRDEYSLEADAIGNPSNLRKTPSPAAYAPPDESEYVAHLLPCGHDLHNDCLKPWVERANSCPICRASFNMVELSAKLGGPIISSYPVQDKLQVADIDPSMIVEEDLLLEEDDEHSEGCMVCEDFGDPSQLMECNGCELLCHVFCAGLDSMPTSGAWYCQTCLEDPAVLSEAQRRPPPRNPAAFRGGRNRRRHADRQPNAWTLVWQTVWERIHLDLDFPFDDDEQSSSGRTEVHRNERTPAQRAERAEWERRYRVAQRNGAGDRFRQSAAILHHPRAREPPKTPLDPESQEELRAWNAFEKAKEQLRGGSSNSGRRKRKSPTSSPSESEPREPQRRLKRPRTKMNLEIGEPSRGNGESSSTAPAPAPAPAARNSSPRNGIRDSLDLTGAVPNFLQSLLQEVEKPAPDTEDEIVAPQPKRVIVERACSPQNSSPGLSPIYPTPRGMTPPTLDISRPHSPQLQPSPELSPGFSPTSTRYSPYSPADDEARPGRRKKGQHSPGALSSPPRSKDSSPTRANMSYSTKAEIQRMVKVTLKPFYNQKDITSDQYTEINRDVSRMLYDKVGDANALADQDTREKWQKIASEEVDNAVRAIKIAADDTGASSSS